jgi:beta-lactam-binding protein with PASTA domain
VKCIEDALAPADGIVTDQSPEPNSQADKGATVKITVRRPVCG